MKPESRSQNLLSVTRAKAKMYEYGVPEESHLAITRDPARLFTLAIGILGDLAAQTNLKDKEENNLKELQKSLQFSSHFFDAYLQSRLNQDISPYLLIMGSACYYLCDFPGSARVLARRIGNKKPALECLGVEDLLLILLQGDFSKYILQADGFYGEYISNISQAVHNYFANGTGGDHLFQHTTNLRNIAYASGTPQQLLFADVISAVVKKLIENSTWNSLPRYSEIPVGNWSNVFQKDTFIKELWPAQHLLGEYGVYRGKSAVVQMPTSAGKTKATEIIIRSAFLSGRTSLAVIIAPFRALCHEIRGDLVKAFRNEAVYIDELSDVLQTDFSVDRFLQGDQVLVVTPEKLIYVLRHSPELAIHIGLIIYDEGHQFDSGTRGITYELLLTTLKLMVPKEAQSVLISAVISNAEVVGNWLNGENGEVVSGTHLAPTYRSLAFTSWLYRLGQLQFVRQDDPDKQEFYVPRIIEQQQLQLRGREYKERVFPEKTDGGSIALYLGLKQASNGGVAIFCGRKDTASSLCEKIVDAFDRGLDFTKPVEHSNRAEVKRLRFLHERNLGSDAIATQSANQGIYAHHGNTPHGIRLAIEYAMKEGMTKYVICTSTLAQGVNLPIRYLIVPGIYQGAERIKVRDFHNLVGRAGRSGMYTEGSIIFADPIVYDNRESDDEGWRWIQVKELLNPKNSEPCASTLLTIFDPLQSDDRRYEISLEPFDLVNAYIESLEKANSLLAEIVSQHSDKKFSYSGLHKQLGWKINIISAIESFLMAHWDDASSDLNLEEITELARGTLAYFLANDEQREQIVEFFILLAKNIDQRITEPRKRKVFAKTLYGVQTSIALENWVTNHIVDLVSCSNEYELLDTLWPIVAENITNESFRKCDQPDILRRIALEWIQGKPFYILYKIITKAGAQRMAGTRLYRYKLETVVDICENAFAYDGTLVIGAVSELVELIHGEDAGEFVSALQELQKRLKYGLPSSLTVVLYELGFADRVISMELSSVMEDVQPDRNVVRDTLRWRQKEILGKLQQYPSYFSEVYRNLTT